MFRELHPRVPRAPIPVEEQSGLNAAPVAYPETQWLRCSRCGFTMNKARAGGGHGEGIAQTTTNHADYDGDGGDADTYDSMWDTATSSWDITYDGPHYQTDFTASNGCPLCGTFMYE